MALDIHKFGTYEATDEAAGRYAGDFAPGKLDKTEDYAEHLRAHRKPETFAGVPYENPVHGLTVYFDIEGEEALREAVNECMNAIVPGATWYFRARGATSGYTTRVVDVSHSEPFHAAFGDHRCVGIRFDIECDPGWEGPEEEIEADPITALPGAFRISGVKGSLPGRFRLKMLFDEIVSEQYVGFRHDPDAAVDYVQDHNGVTDAAALSGECAQATMDADGATIGTAESKDTNAMRGWWLAVARLAQTDTTASDTTYRARSVVNGSGISGSQDFTTDPVAATVTNEYEKVALGPLPIPAGPVPDLDTGSGYAPEAVDENHATGSVLYSLDAYGVYQTFPVNVQKHTGVAVKIKNTTATPLNATARLYAASGGKPSGPELAYDTVSVPASHDDFVRFTWDANVSPGVTYAVVLTGPNDAGHLKVYCDDAAGYVDGEAGCWFGNLDFGSDGWVEGLWIGSEKDLVAQTSAPTQSSDDGNGRWQSFKLDRPSIVTKLGLDCYTPDSGAMDVELVATPGGSSVKYARMTHDGPRQLYVAPVEIRGNPVPYYVNTADSIYLEIASFASLNRYGYSSSNPYPDGQASLGSAYDLGFKIVGYETESADLCFSSYGRAEYGFGSEVEIIAINSGGGTASADTVSLIPYDEFALTAEVDTEVAGRGLLVDAMSDEAVVVYVISDSGVKPVDQSPIDWIGNPVLWPGVTDIVSDAQGSGTTQPDGASLTVAYKPRYKTPYGG